MLSRFFKRAAATPAEQDSAMAENNPTANPPAATGGTDIDYDKLANALAPKLGEAMTAANKPLLEQMAKIGQPAAPQAAQARESDGGKEKPITGAELQRILDDREARRQSSADRDRFIGDKLKDLPAAYQRQLGNDPSKWSAEEQDLRKQFRGDMDKAGVKVPDVTGNAPAGAQKPGAVIDRTRQTATQKIEAGLVADQTATSRP